MSKRAAFRLAAPWNGIRRRKPPGRSPTLSRVARFFRQPTIYLLFCCLPAQSQQVRFIDTSLPEAPNPQVAAGQNQDQSLGTISGTVVDQNGNFVLAAQVRLTHEGHTEEQEVESDRDGHFIFSDVAPGPFQLTV